MENTKSIIETLKLLPHPEGGYFREVYRSNEFIDKESLPARYGSKRFFSTSIYYLLIGSQVSYFHKLKSDEVWHFYNGSPLIIHCLNEAAGYTQVKLGSNISDKIFPQHLIEKGTWFAAEICDKNSYSLVGCTVAPGFEFDDFEQAKRRNLIEKFPLYGELVVNFTKDDI